MNPSSHCIFSNYVLLTSYISSPLQIEGGSSFFCTYFAHTFYVLNILPS